jgi:hypothetical protein
MYNLEQFCADFQKLVPVCEHSKTQAEATFYCLQGISYVFDKLVNVGYKELLGVGGDTMKKQENESCWCNIHELCMRHPELRKSNVVSRQWRLENDFPSKCSYKSRQIFYEPDVVEWIDQHLRGKKC